MTTYDIAVVKKKGKKERKRKGTAQNFLPLISFVIKRIHAARSLLDPRFYTSCIALFTRPIIETIT